MQASDGAVGVASWRGESFVLQARTGNSPPGFDLPARSMAASEGEFLNSTFGFAEAGDWPAIRRTSEMRDPRRAPIGGSGPSTRTGSCARARPMRPRGGPRCGVPRPGAWRSGRATGRGCRATGRSSRATGAAAAFRGRTPRAAACLLNITRGAMKHPPELTPASTPRLGAWLSTIPPAKRRRVYATALLQHHGG